MKTFKIVGIVVMALLIILGIVIAMQPSEAHLEKSIVIHAPAASIFPEISNFKNFNTWSPWSKMDPDVKHTYEGTDGTVGSRMNWDGPKTGKGSQWIEELEVDKRVKCGMSFEGFEGTLASEFILEPEGAGTKVTWTYDGPNKGLAGKATWIIMGAMISSQFDQGLKDLKSLVESRPQQ